MPRVAKVSSDIDVELLKGDTPERIIQPNGHRTVLIEIPIEEVPPTTWGPRVDMKLNPEQSRAIRRVVASLDRQQARTSKGTRVVNNNTAIQWILDQIEVAATGK